MNIINLLLALTTIPVEEYINPFVVLTQVEVTPDFVDSVCFNLHSPDMLAMLNVQVLWNFRSWGVELIYEPDYLNCLQLRHPLVHELARKLLLVFLIRAVEHISVHEQVELPFFMSLFKVIRNKLRCSESFSRDHCLVPLTACELLSPLSRLRVVHRVRVQVQTSWLNELVLEVHRFGLLIT